MPFCFPLTFSKYFFLNSFMCHTEWIQIKPHILSGLIWVQTSCKCDQQNSGRSRGSLGGSSGGSLEPPFETKLV